MRSSDLGRGPVATRDMKYRIAALRAEGKDIVGALLERHVRAVAGEGYTYEFADGTAAAPVAGG